MYHELASKGYQECYSEGYSEGYLEGYLEGYIRVTQGGRVIIRRVCTIDRALDTVYQGVIRVIRGLSCV